MNKGKSDPTNTKTHMNLVLSKPNKVSFQTTKSHYSLIYYIPLKSTIFLISSPRVLLFHNNILNLIPTTFPITSSPIQVKTHGNCVVGSCYTSDHMTLKSRVICRPWNALMVLHGDFSLYFCLFLWTAEGLECIASTNDIDPTSTEIF